MGLNATYREIENLPIYKYIQPVSDITKTQLRHPPHNPQIPPGL